MDPRPSAGRGNDDIRQPEGQPLILIGVAVATKCFVVFGAALVADGSGDLVDQVLVPSGSHANRLRKDRGASIAANAVKGLVPIVLGGDVQTRHTVRRVIHHRQLFVEGQARKQILNSFKMGRLLSR